MTLEIVIYTLGTLPSLTEAQEANMKALAARLESEINYTDIPELTEEQRMSARRCLLP